MTTNNEMVEPRVPANWTDSLEALTRLYQWIGLGPEEARAATVADAEVFAQETVDLAEPV